MKSAKIYLMAVVSLLTLSCSSNNTQIAENTFIHGNKIYKVIDNELREIGDLNAKEIRKFEVTKPKQRDLGKATLSFVKPGAYSRLKALYRGNFLYYTLYIQGLNDLRENYQSGRLTIEFIDEYGFILHSTEIAVNELTAMVGDDGKAEAFVYHGKTEMSTEINTSIRTYDVTAGIRLKSAYNY
jgi:hypothetical protein